MMINLKRGIIPLNSAKPMRLLLLRSMALHMARNYADQFSYVRSLLYEQV